MTIKTRTRLTDLYDRCCEWIAERLPKRVATFCAIRVMNAAMPEQTVDDLMAGTLVHPDEIGFFDALKAFDPISNTGHARPELKLVLK